MLEIKRKNSFFLWPELEEAARAGIKELFSPSAFQHAQPPSCRESQHSSLFWILLKCCHNSSPGRLKGTQHCSHTSSSLSSLLFSDSFYFTTEMSSHGNDLCVQGEASLLKKAGAIPQRKPQRKHLVTH